MYTFRTDEELKAFIARVLRDSAENDEGIKNLFKALIVQRGYNVVERALELASMELTADGILRE